MSPKSLILPLILVALAALPLAMRESGEARGDAQHRVIIYTPHNEQIRSEFGRAFASWHAREYGEPAEVVWNTPGGTSEIRRILEANAEAALRDNRPIGGNAWGGAAGGGWGQGSGGGGYGGSGGWGGYQGGAGGGWGGATSDYSSYGGGGWGASAGYEGADAGNDILFASFAERIRDLLSK